mmetsp:Transcript_128009/g.410166  ORF Transcript_128009/g.410166 Transcript_128009/m.410166 type:complete len:549 (-) Transcript_128009:355-2001(-)
MVQRLSSRGVRLPLMRLSRILEQAGSSSGGACARFCSNAPFAAHKAKARLHGSIALTDSRLGNGFAKLCSGLPVAARTAASHLRTSAFDFGLRCARARFCSRPRDAVPPLGRPPPPASRRFALLIDGDVFGPAHWPVMIEALSARYDVASVHVFGAPGIDESPSWKSVLERLGVRYVPVPRLASGAKDPNDIAIAMHAVHTFMQGAGWSVALGVQDTDFVYLASFLGEQRCEVVILLPEGHALALAEAFRGAKAEVLRYAPKEENERARAPKLKVVLHASGESTLEPQDAGLVDPMVHNRANVIDALRTLGYMEDDTNPIVPAIAKLFHANRVGALTLWPLGFAMAEVAALLDRVGCSRLQANPGDLIFVFPKATANDSKATLTRYGSRVCAEIAKGGGPFMLKDAPTREVVRVFLERLGYLSAPFDEDVGEAIDVFAAVGKNQRSLQSLGLGALPKLSVHAASAGLHAALALPQSHGIWQLAPQDTALRGAFANKKLIRGVQAQAKEVFEAMEVYLKSEGLPVHRTYNKSLLEVQKHWAGADKYVRR